MQSNNQAEMNMARKICPDCAARGDRATMKPMRDQDDKPIWGCFLCTHTMRRRTWKTKARKEREAQTDARIAQIVAKYGLDGCEPVAITEPTSIC